MSSADTMKERHRRRYDAFLWSLGINGLCIMMLSVHHASDGALESCMRGTFMTRHGSGMDICDVCKDGTFMPEVEHTHRQCFNCSQVNNPGIEVVVQPCNISHDAIIQCIDGYYRRLPRNGRAKDECVRCSPCDHPTRKCMNYTDVVCCHPNYEAVETSENVFQCEERPCSYGEFYSTKVDQCVECPPGTYMPARFHKQTSCVRCAPLERGSEYNSRIFNNCTIRTATIFGCETDYYRDPTGESLTVEAMCSKCTSCQANTIRSCFDFGDNICGNICDTTVTRSFTTIASPENRTCPPEIPRPSPQASNDHLLLIGIVIPVIIVVCTIAIVILIIRVARRKSATAWQTENSTENQRFMLTCHTETGREVDKHKIAYTGERQRVREIH